MTDPVPPRILALWSAPRSRSTAFLRMMIERADFTVLHEPFSHTADFGGTTVDGIAVRNETELIAAIRRTAADKPVFLKDTTDFHYPGLLADLSFLRDARHTFIVRPPDEVIASHFALNPGLQRDEIGFERLWEIYNAVATATGTVPVVISSEDLVERPEQTIRAYCTAVGIPFLAEALSWQPELRPEWQKTRRWHESTSRTMGFTAVPATYREGVHNNQLLAEYHAYHLPFFEEVHRHRLRVGS
jgi:hypothetical protein